jgi:hypothetical protein
MDTVRSWRSGKPEKGKVFVSGFSYKTQPLPDLMKHIRNDLLAVGNITNPEPDRDRITQWCEAGE